MDNRALGLATLLTLLTGAGAMGQIPEQTSFQPSTYGGAGAPGRAPVHYQPRFVPAIPSAMPMPVAVALNETEKGAIVERTVQATQENAADAETENTENGDATDSADAETEQSDSFKPLSGQNFGEAWQEKFPETPDVPQVPVMAVPAMVDAIAPIPYLAYHTTLDGRTHIVPYGPAYVYAPEQLPRPTKKWKRFWSSAPSHKQDMPQVWHLSYYTPMPTIIESEPDWWKRTLGYPRPIWGPMPAAAWLGGLPAARLAKTTMHFYEGSYAEDCAAWAESQQQPHGNGDCPVHGRQAHAHGQHGHAVPNGPVAPPYAPKPQPDRASRIATPNGATNGPMPIIESEENKEENGEQGILE